MGRLVLPHVLVLVLSFAFGALGVMGPAMSATLESVKARNQLICGISDEVPGFAMQKKPEVWAGLDVEFCRAVAAAVLGDASLVVLRPLGSAEGLRALAAGEIDLLSATASWTLSRDTELQVRFVDALLFDGQGFMVTRHHGLASALELSGASICVASGTRAVEAAEAFFARQRMRHQLVTSERWSDMVATYAAGGCTAISADLSALAAVRAALDTPGDHMLLPEIISKEPRGPVVRVGDDRWFAVVRWVISALIEAEELQITSDNVDARRQTQHEDVRRFLGIGSNLGAALGLDEGWAYRVVRQVGSYGEVYERTLGLGSALAMPRGQNRIWSQGGLMYAVPMR